MKNIKTNLLIRFRVLIIKSHDIPKKLNSEGGSLDTLSILCTLGCRTIKVNFIV